MKESTVCRRQGGDWQYRGRTSVSEARTKRFAEPRGRWQRTPADGLRVVFVKVSQWRWSFMRWLFVHLFLKTRVELHIIYRKMKYVFSHPYILICTYDINAEQVLCIGCRVFQDSLAWFLRYTAFDKCAQPGKPFIYWLCYAASSIMDKAKAPSLSFYALPNINK